MTKVTNIFKNLGKAPSQIHKPNIYAEALAETKSKGSYEESAAALAPTTYQASNKLNFLFAKWYANLYHFVSAGLGLATVFMLSMVFSGLGGIDLEKSGLLLYAIFGLAFIILAVLLIGIEIFKGSLAKSIFKNLVVGAKVKFPAVGGLILVMLFSILVSAIGGAILSYEMNDKTVQISTSYNVQSDSIRKLHDDNLNAINESINAHKANLNKGNYWAKYATREKLDKAIENRNQLLASAKSDINLVQSAKDKEVSLNSSEGKNYAVISAVVVLVLELLSILAYWFQYVYHSNCEREAVNFAVLSPTVEVVHQTQSKSELSEIKDLLQNLLSGSNSLQLASNTVNAGSNKVGFSFGVNGAKEVNNAMRHNAMRIIGNCKHCGNNFEKNTTWQKYCNEECRISFWENKTGKKFNKKKLTK